MTSAIGSQLQRIQLGEKSTQELDAPSLSVETQATVQLVADGQIVTLTLTGMANGQAFGQALVGTP